MIRLALSISLIATVSCTLDRSDAQAMARVHVRSNGVIPAGTALPVRFQQLNEPVLARLASREHLRDLIAGVPRQFDQMVRVQDWVNAQWADGTPDPYPPWDALTVLDWIRSGRTGGFCGQYAQVFLQSLAALGFTARYVEIGSRQNPYAHYVTEVWSNDFDKWVMMDADYNLHFERNSVPLSALEIHDALIAQKLADVVPVFAKPRPGHATPTMWPMDTEEFYYYLRYHLNADQLSRPADPPFDRYWDMVEFADARTTGWEFSQVDSPFPKTRLTYRSVSDPQLVSAKLNQVLITVRSAWDDKVTLDLRDNVLQRESYEYRMTSKDAPAASWQSTSVPVLTVRLPARGGLLEVRGVNIRGVAGPASALTIDPTSNGAVQ